MYKNSHAQFTSHFDKDVFAERLKQTRQNAELSQKQLAKMIDEYKEANYISNIENRVNSVSIDGAVEIANALGVSLDYLCNRDDFISEQNSPSLGDVAKALIILYYLDGVEIKVKSETLPSADFQQSFKKNIPCIRLYRGELRRFLSECLYKLRDRSDPHELIDWLEKQLAKLDNMPVASSIEDERWQDIVRKMKRGGISEKEVERIMLGGNTNADLSTEDY